MHGKRDANEGPIVEYWESLGAAWHPFCEKEGCDGVLVYRGVVYLVEIKNPARKWKLTDAEIELAELVGRAGGKVHIIQDKTAAAALIGIVGV